MTVPPALSAAHPDHVRRREPAWSRLPRPTVHSDRRAGTRRRVAAAARA